MPWSIDITIITMKCYYTPDALHHTWRKKMKDGHFSLKDVDEFYKNPPEWARNGGPDGYWSDMTDWSSTCHIVDEEESE